MYIYCLIFSRKPSLVLYSKYLAGKKVPAVSVYYQVSAFLLEEIKKQGDQKTKVAGEELP